MEDTIRIASEGITEELRKLNVGEVVAFPVDKYNPSTIRSTPSSSLLNERLKSGKKWITSTDFDEGCVYVARVK